jgi:hypothetical protein
MLNLPNGPDLLDSLNKAFVNAHVRVDITSVGTATRLRDRMGELS